jgi:hypothetical protein
MSIRGYIGVVALVVAAMLCSIVDADAQYLRERGLVREGNRNFNKQNYRTSLNRYNSALEHDATNYEALYNRANAYHHLRRTNPQDSTLTAETTFRQYEAIAADTLLTKGQRAEVLRNLGESLFSEEKYEAALNAFRESLLLNPDDKETKYDYVLTKRIVDQKRQQPQQENEQNENNDQQQNQDNKNDNQQNQGDNNQEQQSENEEQNPEQQPEQPDEEQGEGEDEQGEGEQPQPKELNSDQERMLNAIQAEEDKTQEKLKEGEKALLIPGKKNW